MSQQVTGKNMPTLSRESQCVINERVVMCLYLTLVLFVSTESLSSLHHTCMGIGLRARWSRDEESERVRLPAAIFNSR
jgi:hypothetical protein